MKWECIAITLDEVTEFLKTLQRTKDENEKVLRDQIQTHLIPILQKDEEARKRKALQRERELLNLAKMANAKRSSRIAGRMEQKKREAQAQEEEQRQQASATAARRDEEIRQKLERERESRMMARERRLKDRETRRSHYESELAQLSRDSETPDLPAHRTSGRQLQQAIQKTKQALQDLGSEEEDWVFDCVCGVYGQVDDGTHSIACERCNIWQHSKCVGISEEEADRPEFHFVCAACRRKELEASTPSKLTIKLKVKSPNHDGGLAPKRGSLRDSSNGLELNLASNSPTNRSAPPNGEGVINSNSNNSRPHPLLAQDGVTPNILLEHRPQSDEKPGVHSTPSACAQNSLEEHGRQWLEEHTKDDKLQSDSPTNQLSVPSRKSPLLTHYAEYEPTYLPPSSRTSGLFTSVSEGTADGMGSFGSTQINRSAESSILPPVSAGISPVKPSVSLSSSFNECGNHSPSGVSTLVSPPPALSPVVREQISTPPVKPSSPPSLHRRPSLAHSSISIGGDN